MTESDRRNLRRIVEFADALFRTMDERRITREQILSDTYTQWAVTTPLYNIGEFTSHVSRDLKAENPQVPWSKVAGLRHRLVHDYEGTSWDIIVEVIFDDLPAYVGQVRDLLER